jgi:AraC-like DNA-binding protein
MEMPMPPADRLIRNLLVFDLEEFTADVAGEETTAHVHPFWQMDIYLAGWTEVWSERDRTECTGLGQVMLFPPLTWHTYACRAGHRRATLKMTLGPRLWPAPSRLPLPGRIAGPLLDLLTAAEGWLPGRTGLREAEALALAELCLACVLEALPPPHDDPPPHDAFTARLAPLLEAIADRPQAPWTVANLARSCAVTGDHFTRRFTALLGQTPQRYLLETRLHAAAAELLADPEAPVKQVAERAGYASVHAFTRAFTRLLGAPPATFRRSQGRH